LKEKKTILYLLLILGIVFLAAIAFGFGKGINTIGEVVYRYTGNLSVVSTPTSASLYIDNAYKGLTPRSVSGLSVGNHAIRINKTGYSVYSITKYINAGANSLSATLVANQTNQTNITTGSLSVTSTPSSASLYVDNAYKGLTPKNVMGLSVGNHAIRINKTGYNVYNINKYINAGANSLSVNLVANQTNQTNITISCASNSQCNSTSFCEKSVGLCNATGICRTKPSTSSCSTPGALVCGCNNMTYNNKNCANAYGVSLKKANSAC